jgi:hypothetical protein
MARHELTPDRRDFLTARKVPATVQGEFPTTRPERTTTPQFDGRGGVYGPSMMPFMPMYGPETWSKLHKPKFTGHPSEYARFEEEWDEYEREFQALHPMAWNEHLKFHEFEQCLDAANQKFLKWHRQENPSIVLNEFKMILRSKFGADLERQARTDLDSLRIKMTGPRGRELTYADWFNFQVDYQLARRKAPDLTQNDDWRMIAKQLPEYWYRELCKEQDRQRERKPWVRVRVPPGYGARDVLRAIEDRLQENVPDYELCSSGCIIHAGDKEERSRWLALNRECLDGQPITVTPFDYGLSADEIFSFIEKRLKQEEAANEEAKRLGIVPERRATAVAVPIEATLAQVTNQPARQYPEAKAKWQAPTKSQPRATKFCKNCQVAGRVFAHFPTQCDFTCRTCLRNRKPSAHNYRECEDHKAEFEKEKRKELCMVCKWADERPDYFHSAKTCKAAIASREARRQREEKTSWNQSK